MSLLHESAPLSEERLAAAVKGGRFALLFYAEHGKLPAGYLAGAHILGEEPDPDSPRQTQAARSCAAALGEIIAKEAKLNDIFAMAEKLGCYDELVEVSMRSVPELL